MTAGEKVRKYRQRHGLTQRGLARLSGISHYTITRIESGQRPVGPEVALKLAAAFRVHYTKFYKPTTVREAKP